MDKEINIKVDLAKIRGAFSLNVKGTSSTKECICIPKDMLYQGKNGACYLDITGYDANGKFDQLYTLKQKLGKDAYAALSKEERMKIPFVGSVSAMKPRNAASSADAPAFSPASASGADEDFPF